MKPIERVKELINYLDISISAFEKATGMSNNSIQTAIKRVSNLKDDTLNSILNKYPEVSAEWLLTGKGSMLSKGISSGHTLTEPGSHSGGTNELLKEKIAFQSEQIDFYKSKIEFLTTQLNAKKIPEGKELEEGMKIIDKIEESLSKKFS
jgi:hypothetical protein